MIFFCKPLSELQAKWNKHIFLSFQDEIFVLF